MITRSIEIKKNYKIVLTHKELCERLGIMMFDDDRNPTITIVPDSRGLLEITVSFTEPNAPLSS